uniref:Oxysterol-binding protein n=1 Tax=Salmo trutta TaxID=8032 RepID=A0A674CL61_SALTR
MGPGQQYCLGLPMGPGQQYCLGPPMGPGQQYCLGPPMGPGQQYCLGPPMGPGQQYCLGPPMGPGQQYCLGPPMGPGQQYCLGHPIGPGQQYLPSESPYGPWSTVPSGSSSGPWSTVLSGSPYGPWSTVLSGSSYGPWSTVLSGSPYGPWSTVLPYNRNKVHLRHNLYVCSVHTKQDSTDGSHPLVHQASNESRASITESLSEFFDAQEVLLSASSSENEASDDDSYISDNVSDNISMDNFSNETERPNSGKGPLYHVRRRSCLPSASPNTSNISLWNILKNNIGKDLSKVAMPVQLNEPLNTLQRLCEELEYSELLDRAANTQDPFERMVYVATFAVSGYASSYHRAGGKPFNPVLGETYECDRPDKGLRFIAEQVSHHPPISACHADSKNYIFWQDMRWKNKFWGKSMEIVPVGTTHVILPGFGDHYEWNKVTSCIHNILSGQRWIEHYGEISIRNTSTDICQCKVTFIKVRDRGEFVVNEVEGTITDHKGKVIHRLFGKWNEGMYCGDPPSATCIWRANAMPADHEQYYGFTKFAMELNELDPSLKLLLPPTDTRLRLDQRLLEEGNVEAAEEQKQNIEQQQRDRRRVLEENTMTHQPTFFRKSKDDTWVSNNTYWDLRSDPGFAHLDCPVLW